MDSIARKRLLRRKRDEAMIAARAMGKTHSEIGREFGLSGSTVAQRIKYTTRQQQLEQSKNPFDRIKPHTARVLKAAGLMTIEQVFEKYFAAELLDIPQFGYKALRDVEQQFALGYEYSRTRGFILHKPPQRFRSGSRSP